MKKLLIWFLIIIAAVILAYFIFSTRSYPVATVNTGIISAQQMEDSFRTGFSYYQKEASIALNQEELGKPEFQEELRRATLDKLIEHELIHQLLYDLLGDQEAKILVDSRVGEVRATRTKETDNAVLEIFSVNWEAFEDLVIRPEAERETLASYIENEDIAFIPWFDQQLRSADVKILLSGFEWVENEVEIIQ